MARSVPRFFDHRTCHTRVPIASRFVSENGEYNCPRFKTSCWQNVRMLGLHRSRKRQYRRCLTKYIIVAHCRGKVSEGCFERQFEVNIRHKKQRRNCRTLHSILFYVHSCERPPSCSNFMRPSLPFFEAVIIIGWGSKPLWSAEAVAAAPPPPPPPPLPLPESAGSLDCPNTYSLP